MRTKETAAAAAYSGQANRFRGEIRIEIECGFINVEALVARESCNLEARTMWDFGMYVYVETYVYMRGKILGFCN